MGACPACDAALTWRHNGLWCDRCHRKVETCCEGAPQQCGDPAPAPDRTGLREPWPVLPSSPTASAVYGPWWGPWRI